MPRPPSLHPERRAIKLGVLHPSVLRKGHGCFDRVLRRRAGCVPQSAPHFVNELLLDDLLPELIDHKNLQPLLQHASVSDTVFFFGVQHPHAHEMYSINDRSCSKDQITPQSTKYHTN